MSYGNKTLLRLLTQIGRNGELTLSQLSVLLDREHNDHTDFYPLVILIESGYVGLTFNHNPPTGAEEMREFSLAYSLHMLTLKQAGADQVKYKGVTSSGSLDPSNEKVFIKAKGSFFLSELVEKRRDRLVYFSLGLVSGLIALFAKDGIQMLLARLGDAK